MLDSYLFQSMCVIQCLQYNLLDRTGNLIISVLAMTENQNKTNLASSILRF